MDEDRVAATKIATGPQAGRGSWNFKNDRRVVECANARHVAGLKTMLLTNDRNMAVMAKAAGIKAFMVGQVWRIMNDRRFGGASPDTWDYYSAELQRLRNPRTDSNPSAFYNL